MKAIIISNGVFVNYSFFKSKITDNDYIICADGAIKHCIGMGVVPHLWIGDFDSCNYEKYCNDYPLLKDVETLTLKKDKDETDTHVACIIASQKNYDEIVIWGALGKRADHMLSNIHLLEWLNKRNISAVIEDEHNKISVFDSVYTTQKTHKYLSLIPLDKSVTVDKTEGLLFPLKSYELSRDISMGVSNEIVGDYASVHIHGGLMLAIHSDD